MSQNLILANSILWASAIVGSAMLGAPNALTLALLPTLGAAFLLVSMGTVRRKHCSA